MWFDGIRQPNTLYVASVSRGKDSTAMLEAIKLMGWPLDMVVSVDIWFDDDTPAELPPMVAFKDEWDRKCREHFGVPVIRLCAKKRGRTQENTSKLTYVDIFYRPMKPKQREGETEEGTPDIRIPDYWRAMVQLNAQNRSITDSHTQSGDGVTGSKRIISDRVFQ